MRPNAEQLEALNNLVRAMMRLTELWDENLNDEFQELPESHRDQLLPCSFDGMAFAWMIWRDLLESKRDYFHDVIETLRSLREGIAYASEDQEERDERLNHLDDAELWIRTHVLDSSHPLAID